MRLDFCEGLNSSVEILRCSKLLLELSQWPRYQDIQVSQSMHDSVLPLYPSSLKPYDSFHKIILEQLSGHLTVALVRGNGGAAEPSVAPCDVLVLRRDAQDHSTWSNGGASCCQRSLAIRRPRLVQRFQPLAAHTILAILLGDRTAVIRNTAHK